MSRVTRSMRKPLGEVSENLNASAEVPAVPAAVKKSAPKQKRSTKTTQETEIAATEVEPMKEKPTELPEVKLVVIEALTATEPLLSATKEESVCGTHMRFDDDGNVASVEPTRSVPQISLPADTESDTDHDEEEQEEEEVAADKEDEEHDKWQYREPEKKQEIPAWCGKHTYFREESEGEDEEKAVEGAVLPDLEKKLAGVSM